MKLKLVGQNVANAMRDDNDKDNRFGLRFDDLIEFHKNLDADIIMLQEIRRCKNKNGDGMLEPLDIAYRFARELNMQIAGFEPVNSTEASFWRLTLYNPSKLWHVKSIPIRSYNTKNVDYKFGKDFGSMALISEFYLLGDERMNILGTKKFYVYNIHFPMRLDDKMKYIDLLDMGIEDYCHEQIIMVGDCNVFMDAGGVEQLEKMKSLGYSEHTGHIPATFTPFPQDPFYGKVKDSHLDYVFTYNKYTDGIKIIKTETIDLRDQKRMISDHFPIIIYAEIL
jgi:endonuclease/exonuclease/phosphatase family metal-dependent hydrolase